MEKLKFWLLTTSQHSMTLYGQMFQDYVVTLIGCHN